MRKFNQWFVGGLIAGAIFIICNCAGYLLITIIGTSPVFQPLITDQIDSNPISPEATSAGVVAYATPTEAELTPVQQSPLVAPLPPTPASLLPTITPASATPQLASPSTSIPLPPSTAPPPPSAQERATVQANASSQLTIVSHKSYVDSLGWYHIVGEVQNNGSAPVEFVEVMAKLYDESHRVIGTKITFTAPDVIFPGGKAPFDLITLRRAQWDQIKEYKLQVRGDVSQALLQENLVLLNQSSRIEGEELYVQGQVQNVGTTPTLVKLIITLYDANLKVVNTNWGYADAGIITPQQTSSFEINIRHQTDPNNFHYRIQIEEAAVDTK